MTRNPKPVAVPVPRPPGSRAIAREAEAHRQAEDAVYEAMMRGGGEPFGPPFELGLSTLTHHPRLRQTGFFGFETMERLQPRNQRNRFTRHGAAPFLGEHRPVRRRGS